VKPERLTDKATIERYLRLDPQLHLYGLGDLDDFYWQHTTWFAGREGGEIRALALLYRGMSPPTLLALSREPERLRSLLRGIVLELPASIYLHLSPGVEDVMRTRFALRPHGRHHRMVLTQPERVQAVRSKSVIRLKKADLHALKALYEVSYPGNWFDPRMLETDHYFGIRRGGELISVAGVHVYSRQYGVAALGNVTTHPAHRGRGWARLTTAHLCCSLLDHVHTVGLNVKSDNLAAISLYRSLGLEVIADYDEHMAESG